MLIKLVTSILALCFILCALLVLYNALFYPIVQFFKRKKEFGYVLTKDGQYEHRAKVQKMIGQRLGPEEEVHHINGKKWDNKKSNLALMTRGNHKRWHQRLE